MRGVQVKTIGAGCGAPERNNLAAVIGRASRIAGAVHSLCYTTWEPEDIGSAKYPLCKSRYSVINSHLKLLAAISHRRAERERNRSRRKSRVYFAVWFPSLSLVCGPDRKFLAFRGCPDTYLATRDKGKNVGIGERSFSTF